MALRARRGARTSVIEGSRPMIRHAPSAMLRIQIATVLVLTAVAAFWTIELGPALPRARLIASTVLFGGLIAFHIVSVARTRMKPGFTDDTPDGWRRHTLTGISLGAFVIVALVWLTLPYEDESGRLLGVLFCQAWVAGAAIGTVKRPRGPPASLWRRIVPGIVPAGIIGFYLTHPSAYTLPVILFSVAFCALMLLLRSVVQATATMVWRAKGEADAQRDAKARFVASASHDLGQPLQAARLFFDQAIRSSDPAARTRATASAEAAFDAVERQLQRMNEYLRLEAGAVSARFADVAAGEPIARAAALAEAAAARAGVALHVVSSRLWARADADLIERALSNLIDNALRHAKARRLLIGARSHGPRVRLWVIDDGVGIAVEDRARLFEDYVQGSDHGDETRGGFGLGLASVRRIAALMHGTAGFATNTRRGSAFYLELPRSITQAQRDAIVPDMR
jgi:signal transduction histidine kinase